MKKLLTGDNLIHGNAVLGQAVIEELQRESSKYGPYEDIKNRNNIEAGDVIIAGASVATAVLKLLNIQGVNMKINDVDVFIDSNARAYKEELEKIDLKARNKVVTADVSELGATYDQYGEIMVTKLRKYKVIYSLRSHLINKVFVKYSNNHTIYGCDYNQVSHKIEKLVGAFDFNCVQVGVDLKTGELYGTPEFWNFLATKQVSLENLNTPSHSLIRYFKKKEELGDGVYFNDEFIITACLISIRKLSQQYFFDDEIPKNFGKETMMKAELVFDELQKYVFMINEESIHRSYQTYRFEVKDSVFDEIMNALNLASPTSTLVMNIPLTELIEVLKLYTSGRKSDRKFFDSLADDRNKDVQKFQNLSFLIRKMPSFFIKEKHKDEGTLKQISKLLEHNLTHQVFYLGLDGTKDFANKVKPLVGKFGDEVYGKMEGIIQPITNFEKIKAEIVKEGLEAEKPLIEYSFNSKNIDGYKIKELVSIKELKTEGKQMKHCVGGYSASVKAGDKKIISFKNEEKMKRITVEVRLADKKTEKDELIYIVIQMQHYRNQSANQDIQDFVKESLVLLSKETAIVVDRFSKQATEVDEVDEVEIPF